MHHAGRFFLHCLPIFLLLAWFASMAFLQDKAVRAFENNTTPSPPDLSASAPWRASRLFSDPDSYAWLSFARDLRESPHFRVRWTFMDNAPFGRPVHWAQLPIWSLCGVSFLLEQFGVEKTDALELAGRILPPLLGFLAFSSLWFVLRRRIPPLLAALVVLASATALFWDFHPLRLDHHGFHLVAALFFVLPLLGSSFGFASPSYRNRIPFLLSGIFGGIALWLGATVFCFTLAAAAIAAAISLLPRRTSGTVPHDFVVWRLWGLSGTLSSIFFWLLEYAPDHFSMRLEANHPLYALSFLGIGETLFWIARFRHVSPSLSPLRVVHLLLALAAAAALPALLLFGPVSWYLPRSPFMLRLHARHIQEFLSLFAVAGKNPHHLLAYVALPCAIAASSIFLTVSSCSGRTSPPLLRRRLLFVLPFCLLFMALYIWQFRWERMAILATMLPVVVFGKTHGSSRSFWRFLPHFLLALQISVAAWDQYEPLSRFLRGGTTDPNCLRSFQYRACSLHFAQALSAPGVERARNAESPAVLAPFEFAPYLWYFARIPAVASFYWENLDGDSDTAAAFAAPSPNAVEAREIIYRRNISHVFMAEGAQDAVMSCDLALGVDSHAAAARSLGGLLAGARPRGTPLPPWLGVDPTLNALSTPILYEFVPELGKFAPLRLPFRIYTVRPD